MGRQKDARIFLDSDELLTCRDRLESVRTLDLSVSPEDLLGLDLSKSPEEI